MKVTEPNSTAKAVGRPGCCKNVGQPPGFLTASGLKHQLAKGMHPESRTPETRENRGGR